MAKAREKKLKGKKTGRSKRDEEMPTALTDHRSYPLADEHVTVRKGGNQSRSTEYLGFTDLNPQ